MEEKQKGSSTALSRLEVMRRRRQQREECCRQLRIKHWELVEEQKARVQAYDWTYGKSPFAAEGGGEGNENGIRDDDNGENGDRRRCAVAGCKSMAVPLTRYCHPHILNDPRQTLYKPRNFILRRFGFGYGFLKSVVFRFGSRESNQVASSSHGSPPRDKKILSNSDISAQQNRFLIPITDVRERLLPLLSLNEQQDANLLCLMNKKRKKYDKKSSGTNGGDHSWKQTEVGRKHGGLAVRLIVGDREIGVTLTQWDETLGVVLKGGTEWKIVVAEQKLREGECVELLAFRRSAIEEKPGETAKLCFLLRRKEYNRSDDTATAEPALQARKVTNINRSEPLDLLISLDLPAYSTLQNGPNSTSKSFIAEAVVKQEEKVCGENGLNLELTLRQPGSGL
uniref:KAT8 regulatory NSL complex subunit 2 n=1 Tax=Ananas comosus var. bracteatus TaxID=296719 RepID=A0A6V7P171_ANACO|nr:unnamed protein product [Ananas comosus var. bracteatus]